MTTGSSFFALEIKSITNGRLLLRGEAECALFRARVSSSSQYERVGPSEDGSSRRVRISSLLTKLPANLRYRRKALLAARHYSRFVCPKGTLSAWQGGGKRTVSFVENLSLGGICLRTRDVLSPGTALQLLLDLPAGQVRARAIVEWSKEKKGMGARFIAMQHEDRGRLSRWLNTQKR